MTISAVMFLPVIVCVLSAVKSFTKTKKANTGPLISIEPNAGPLIRIVPNTEPERVEPNARPIRRRPNIVRANVQRQRRNFEDLFDEGPMLEEKVMIVAREERDSRIMERFLRDIRRDLNRGLNNEDDDDSDSDDDDSDSDDSDSDSGDSDDDSDNGDESNYDD